MVTQGSGSAYFISEKDNGGSLDGIGDAGKLLMDRAKVVRVAGAATVAEARVFDSFADIWTIGSDGNSVEVYEIWALASQATIAEKLATLHKYSK